MMDFSIKPEGKWPLQASCGMPASGSISLPAAEEHPLLSADELQKGIQADRGLYSPAIQFPEMHAEAPQAEPETSSGLRFDDDSPIDDLTGSLSWQRTFSSRGGERAAALTQAEGDMAQCGASLAGKRAVITQIIGGDCDPRDRALIEEGLSSFSLENLLLLSQHNVRYMVRTIGGMPADFKGIRVREHFMKGHRALIDDCFKAVVNKYDRFSDMNGETMNCTRKERFLKEQMVQKNLTLGNRDRDFGQMSRVTADNVDDIENISYNAACAVHDARNDESAIFLLQNGLSKGVIIHETAHILDSLKHDAEPRAFSPTPVPPENSAQEDGLWGSQRDEALKQHYESFIRECSQHPEKRWSDYALGRNMDITEYLAEAVRMYVEKPQVLKEADPAMFVFAQTFIEKAEYRSPGLSGLPPG